jgi:hypothetical protein
MCDCCGGKGGPQGHLHGIGLYPKDHGHGHPYHGNDHGLSHGQGHDHDHERHHHDHDAVITVIEGAPGAKTKV